MDAMEEKSLSAKKKERIKEEDAEQNLMEESVQEDEIESTPLAFSTPVTGKRRGRPPKTATSVKTPDVKSYPKRNRRAPIKFEENEERDKECSFTMDTSHTASIASETSLNITKNSTNDGEQLEQVPKSGRKRGRAKKSLEDSVEEVTTPKRKRGKCAATEEVGDDSVSDKKDSKARRGRQKSKKDNDVSDDSAVEDDTGGSKTGRKSRSQNVSRREISASKNTSTSSKGSRKVQETSQILTSDDEFVDDSDKDVTPARKGRKSKKTELDAEGEATCLRCQEKLPNLISLKNHLMRKHSAIYSAKCPEGKDDRTAVKQILKIRKVLYCPKCDKELRNIQYYYKHYEWCGRESETYTCTVCSRECMKMHEVEHYRNHKLQEKKKKEKEELRERQELEKKKQEEENKEEVGTPGRRVRKAAKKAVNVLKDISISGDAFGEDDDNNDDPDLKLDVEEDDEDDQDDDLEEDVSDESALSDPDAEGDSEEEEKGKKARTATPRKNILGADVYTEVYMHCLKNFLKRCELIDSMPDVFPEIKPRKSQWRPQDAKEIEDFLPTTTESLRFQVVSPGKKTNPIQRLKRFEAKFIDETYNLFAGGPVWGLAWCPVPHNVQSDQFLAISCHRGMNEKHETRNPFTGKGSIQLWNVGKLNSNLPEESIKKSHVPFVEFCISHVFGVIYQLCWCPSNAWENNNDQDKASELLPRLGLLAGAFSDGNVHIYSVPHPSSLSTDKPTDTPTSFKPSPAFSLIPFSTSKQDKVVPCLCVDWQPKSCQFIGAGYGDGTLRVWDLKSQSSLLKIATTPTITLLPFHSTIAHFDSIMAFRWSPHVTDKFATSSRDRTFAVWNLKNRHFPMYRSPAQMSTSIFWLAFNFCILQGMDDCYTHLEAYVRAESYDHVQGDEISLSDPVVAITDCIWGLTGSNYLMVILTSNNAGIVSGSIMPRLKREEAKRFHRRPVVVYETAVHEFDFQNEPDMNAITNKPKKTKKAETAVFTSYESGKDSVFLEYREYDQSKTKRKLPLLSVPADDIRSIPFRAIYRTEMCPNIQSCTWVASGGQAGIVRVHSVASQLLPTTAKDLKEALSSLKFNKKR